MDNDNSSFFYAKSKRVSISVSPQIFILFVLLTNMCWIVSGQTGDGVAITKPDYGALRAIKQDLIDFTGVLRSWNNTGAGACSGKWIGIKCVNGQVIAIQLPWKGLGGRISDKVGQLQALRRISLHDNVLGGAIPPSLGYLPNLRGVYLFNNRLSGHVPASLANCPVLQALDLSNNQLTGVIPASVANSARLYRLNLSHNSLSGPVPVTLTRSPSLTFLALQHNNLSGPVPDSWAAGGNNTSYHLQILTLDHNLLSGKIPATLLKLGSLQRLALSHNNISGVIPDDFGRLSRLQALDLSDNVINGSIPDSIHRLRNLTELSLKNNKLSGGIPATIGNISGLSRLDLSGNGFDGEIPTTLSRLTNLSFFNVSYNNLSGPVPSPLAQKFNSSSFAGNLQLCGYSPATMCPSSPPPTNSQPVNVPPPAEEAHKKHKLSAKDIIFIVVGALIGVLILLCCILLLCLFRKRAALKQKNGGKAVAGKVEKSLDAAGSEVQSGGEMGGKLVHFDGPFVFTADDLLCATAEIMGKSAYGTAYKATLEDGSQVVVKRLREKTTKGQREFESEAATLGKVRHPNLLALRAYYLGPKGEKLLVFDYMSRGSLASFLHARGPETGVDWETRIKITVGIARGLNHLHIKENIIHGNLTSSNVLLDEQTNAHIADYGLSRLMTAAASTNVVATAGTLGYRAPELSKLKNASTKTDVYSLGVIILELLTGKSPGEPTNGMDLPQWVASIVKEEWTNEVFDLELMRDQSTIGDELLNTLKLALHCVDPSPAARPEVKEILHQLQQIKPELTAASTAARGDDRVQAPPAKDDDE